MLYRLTSKYEASCQRHLTIEHWGPKEILLFLTCKQSTLASFLRITLKKDKLQKKKTRGRKVVEKFEKKFS